MTIYRPLSSFLLSLDRGIANSGLRFTKEQGTLLIFLFHSLFESRREAQSGVMDPQQGITVEMFRTMVRYFRAQSYSFVSSEQVAEGLPPEGKYVLLTFDDGYHNNVRALPTLEEFNSPAVFFISSNHVKLGKSFWWDVVYREGKKHGRSDAKIGRTMAGYKKLRTEEVEANLKETFGEDALLPVSDLDRPFTPSELHDFANHPLVFFGNHTNDHAILSNYSESEITSRICEAQNDILELTGHVPKMIAYPNGTDSAKIRSAAEKAGLRLGIGIRPGHNRLPLNNESADPMALKRFTLRADSGVEQQCRSSRSSFSIYRLLQNMKRKSIGRAFDFAVSMK
jgi:peptidoglycan/xylan/chitin deacetylase (PgdA/CDA1 family)